MENSKSKKVAFIETVSSAKAVVNKSNWTNWTKQVRSTFPQLQIPNWLPFEFFVNEDSFQNIAMEIDLTLNTQTRDQVLSELKNTICKKSLSYKEAERWKDPYGKQGGWGNVVGGIDAVVYIDELLVFINDDNRFVNAEFVTNKLELHTQPISITPQRGDIGSTLLGQWVSLQDFPKSVDSIEMALFRELSTSRYLEYKNPLRLANFTEYRSKLAAVVREKERNIKERLEILEAKIALYPSAALYCRICTYITPEKERDEHTQLGKTKKNNLRFRWCHEHKFTHFACGGLTVYMCPLCE